MHALTLLTLLLLLTGDAPQFLHLPPRQGAVSLLLHFPQLLVMHALTLLTLLLLLTGDAPQFLHLPPRQGAVSLCLLQGLLCCSPLLVTSLVLQTHLCQDLLCLLYRLLQIFYFLPILFCQLCILLCFCLKIMRDS